MTKSTGLAEHLIAAHSEDVNSEGGIPDYEGCAPLHAAAQSGYREVAELLLGSSASLDDIERLLIDRGADVNAQEEDRWTALHLASFEEHLTTLAFTPRVVALTHPRPHTTRRHPHCPRCRECSRSTSKWGSSLSLGGY